MENHFRQEDFESVNTAMKNSSLDSHFRLNENKTTINAYFLIPNWRISLWSLLFGLMVMVSVFGNGIVIWIVFFDKKMRTVTNYFLVNLAVSDVMLSTLNTVFSFVSMVTHNWPFGNVFCTITQYVSVLSVASSSFTLAAISVKRYIAIVHPLRKRMNKQNTSICLAIVWLMSILIALPHAIYASVDEADQLDRYICQLYWPDGRTFVSFQEFVYNMALTLTTYIFPMLTVSCIYTKIARELWGSSVIGEATFQQLKIIKSKRKIVKMLMVVIGIFSVCWLPYHLYFLFSWICPSINEWELIQEVFLIIYWLAMSSSMYNPLIYCWMNSRFQTSSLLFIIRSISLALLP